MATYITFSKAMDGSAPVIAAQSNGIEAITATGTSAQTTITAQQGDACVVDSDEAVYVSFGDNPNAATDTNRHVIPAGGSKSFGRLQAGWKAAVVTV